MSHKTRLIFLLVLDCALASALALSVFIESAPFRVKPWSWLDPAAVEAADRIEIYQRGAYPPAQRPGEEPDDTGVLILVRKGGVWYVSRKGVEFPAREARVLDFLGILSARGDYPVRSSSASSHERLGLGEEAFRIRVRGGAGPPLLDLLVGNVDSLGKEVYLRRAGENEVRSGEDRFSGYLVSGSASWYDLRLFPGAGNRVERLSAVIPGKEPLVITRSEGGWAVSGIQNPDRAAVENYIRSLLSAEGEDFSENTSAADPRFNEGRLAVEMSDGKTHMIRIGPGDESGRRLAAIPGLPWVYILAPWTADRLFREASFFIE